MAREPQTMLAELPEASATGRIAEIYHEIRRCSGVPYVSSLQRYLATLPGVLEWAWDALRPAMMSGVVPETGWRLAGTVRLPPARPLAAAALRNWGIDGGALDAIRNIATNFVRVSPVNLVTGACLRQLLTGERPSGAGFEEPWQPPAMLPPMPGNADPLALPPDQRAVLMRFATEVDGKPFIPALYRQIAHWPAILGWLADELAPRFAAAETVAARAASKAAARDAAPAIVARLPGLPGLRACSTINATDCEVAQALSPCLNGPLYRRADALIADAALSPPDADTTRRILATIDRYAETSPEMTMFGQLILGALPMTVAG